LSSIKFSFRGKRYTQVFGTVMGSPVALVVANLVMEDVAKCALVTFGNLLRPSAFVEKICRRHICDHYNIKVIQVFHPCEHNRELIQLTM